MKVLKNTKAEWLRKNTFNCGPLRAKISANQCVANQVKAHNASLTAEAFILRACLACKNAGKATEDMACFKSQKHRYAIDECKQCEAYILEPSLCSCKDGLVYRSNCATTLRRPHISTQNMVAGNVRMLRITT